MKTKKQIPKHVYLIVGIAVLFICASFFGGHKYAAKFWKKEIQQRQETIEEAENKVIKFQDSLDGYVKEDSADQVIQYDEYWKYRFEAERRSKKYWMNKHNELERKQFDIEYLLWLKNNVLYK